MWIIKVIHYTLNAIPALLAIQYLGQQVCIVMLGRNVACQNLFHGNRLTHSVVTYRIALLLQLRLRSLSIVDNRHVVTIYVRRAINRYARIRSLYLSPRIYSVAVFIGINSLSKVEVSTEDFFFENQVIDEF